MVSPDIAPRSSAAKAATQTKKMLMRYWMAAIYYVAIALAMIGWLWLMVWCALQLI